MTALQAPERQAPPVPEPEELGLARVKRVQPRKRTGQGEKQIEVSSALPPHTELSKLSGAYVAAAWRLVKRSWLCVMVTLQRGECQ